MKKLCTILALCMLLTGCSGNPREMPQETNSSREPNFTAADESTDEMTNSLSEKKENSDNISILSETAEQTEGLSEENTSSEAPENNTYTSESGGGQNTQSVSQGTASSPKTGGQTDNKDNIEPMKRNMYTSNTRISDVINDPVFGEYGRLIFPVNSSYYSGNTLGELRLTWYNNIDSDKTVEITNYLADRAAKGEQVFFDIYTEEEKSADPAKAKTGLFFFRGNENAPFAVCNAGGGFAYVGAMHDSFPHALELSKRGYNAFALIYRPGAQTACEDLARAISFIFANADELGVDTDCYSLWGGSAGGRMSAYLGSLGTEYFGGDDLPKPGAVIMQYTGHGEYTKEDPPTYACVGDSDGIANWQTMERRINALKSYGIPTEFHVYEGLQHGFGIGTGTVAEGWLDDAVRFWEEQR